MLDTSALRYKLAGQMLLRLALLFLTVQNPFLSYPAGDQHSLVSGWYPEQAAWASTEAIRTVQVKIYAQLTIPFGLQWTFFHLCSYQRVVRSQFASVSVSRPGVCVDFLLYTVLALILGFVILCCPNRSMK